MKDVPIQQKLALLLFALGGVSHVVFGLVYLSASEFMPYHSQALSIDWSDLDSDYQTLLLALIKLTGAGGLIAGIINLWMVIYFYRRRMTMLIWVLPVTSVVFHLVLNYAVYIVDTHTPGNPPLTTVTVGSIAFFVATCLLIIGFRRSHA